MPRSGYDLPQRAHTGLTKEQLEQLPPNLKKGAALGSGGISIWDREGVKVFKLHPKAGKNHADLGNVTQMEEVHWGANGPITKGS